LNIKTYFKYAGITGEMNKLRGQLKAFMKNEEKQAIASRIMV